jgi:thioredoxin-dependent peroxiredoxin
MPRSATQPAQDLELQARDSVYLAYGLAHRPQFHFKFPVISDTDRAIGTAYGANADPAKGAQRVGVIIDPDGKIKEWHARVDARAWPAAVVATL